MELYAKVYLDCNITCPNGHTFAIQRKTSSMGKHVKTRCPECKRNFKVLAKVGVVLSNVELGNGKTTISGS